MALYCATTHAVPVSDFPPVVVEEFGKMKHENITSGDIPFRKVYIQGRRRSGSGRDREGKIIGSKAATQQAMTGSENFGPVFAVLY